MSPAIKDGDFLCAAPLQGQALTRGMIVLFHPANDPSRNFYKRVVGLPGESVEIDGSHNSPRVLITPVGGSGLRMLSEPYVATQPWTALNNCCTADGRASVSPAPASIPTGAYFVLGDNRNASYDSRSLGFITAASIFAVVISDQSNPALYSAMPSLAPS